MNERELERRKRQLCYDNGIEIKYHLGMVSKPTINTCSQLSIQNPVLILGAKVQMTWD